MKKLFWERLAWLWILAMPFAIAGGIGYGGQAYNPGSVAISGGTISGVTISASTIPMSNVTGAGSMALQNASSVAITGGTIDGTVIGGTTPSNGTFTTVKSSSNPKIFSFDPLGGSIFTLTSGVYQALTGWNNGGYNIGFGSTDLLTGNFTPTVPGYYAFNLTFSCTGTTITQIAYRTVSAISGTLYWSYASVGTNAHLTANPVLYADSSNPISFQIMCAGTGTINLNTLTTSLSGYLVP